MLLPLLLYIAVGLVVGLGFVLRGVNRVDPAAVESPWVFRIVILPGCVGLWPIVLLKWLRAGAVGKTAKGGDA